MSGIVRARARPCLKGTLAVGDRQARRNRRRSLESVAAASESPGRVVVSDTIPQARHIARRYIHTRVRYMRARRAPRAASHRVLRPCHTASLKAVLWIAAPIQSDPIQRRKNDFLSVYLLNLLNLLFSLHIRNSKSVNRFNIEIKAIGITAL